VRKVLPKRQRGKEEEEERSNLFVRQCRRGQGKTEKATAEIGSGTKGRKGRGSSSCQNLLGNLVRK